MTEELDLAREDGDARIRVFTRTPADVALRLLERGGWEDLHADGGEVGVWCDDAPRAGLRAASGRGVMVAGPDGNTTLCTDLPAGIFRARERQESTRSLTAEEFARFEKDGVWPDGLEYQYMGYAIIPADVLNQYGPPRLWDHEYSGMSRKELLDAAARWGQEHSPGCQEKAKELRAAVAFFDRVGWSTALCLTEESPEDKARPSNWFKLTDPGAADN
jgi:hypothetical protein